MTVIVSLTPDEEARLRAIAEGRGVSPDDLIHGMVQEILGGNPPQSKREVDPQEREREIQELFDTFDMSPPADGVKEEAFHRENWYR